MNTDSVRRVLRSRVALHLAASAGVAASAITSDVRADVVHYAPNWDIPANIDGLYINVETQQTGSSAGAVTGWDINPYTSNSASPSLAWFNATGGGMLRFPGVTTGSAGSLGINTPVNASGSFGGGTVVFGSAPGNWRLNADNYFGFQFIGVSGQTHYGWGKMAVGSTANIRTITQIAYESTPGMPIVVGSTTSILNCDAVQMTATSPQLVPYSFSTPGVWTATGIPASSQGATLTVTARGQLGGTTRFLTVRIDGVILATNVFGAGSGAGVCTANASTVTLPITPAQFAQLTADGQLEVRIEPSINATSTGCANAELEVRLNYVRDIFDCDGSGTDDECQLRVPAIYDCDENGQLDSCEASVPGVDCDGNLIPDVCDIEAGAEDTNENSRLDSCEVAYGDLNLDGVMDGADLAGLLALWGFTNPPYGDFDGDGVIGGGDLAFLLARWGQAPWPNLTVVNPVSGPMAGGTLITITGTNLTGTTVVRVGDRAATNVQAINATTVRAVTPPGTAGAKTVSVVTPAGVASRLSGYTYVAPPTLASVTPASGPIGGGTTITITGTNLTGTSSVRIGGVAATNVQVVSSTTVTAVTPSGSLGSRDVTVTAFGGTATQAGGFTYANVTVPSWATLLEPLANSGVVTSSTLRSAITATGLAWRVRHTTTQIEFVLIPPGTYQRGCSPSLQYGCLSGENPVHQVTLTQPFYLGRYEVTQAQWQARMGSNPSGFQSASTQVPASQVPNRPVESVSWNMIQGFLSATGMRLPTEAEWEWAYRAGTTTAFHSMPGYPNGTNDDSLVGNIGWFGSNSVGQTRPVGGKAGNGFGLHDMSGNVYEWVDDWYGTYPSAAQVDPTGPASGSYRVVRGGSWGSADLSFSVRSSARNNNSPGITFSYVGFRVARTP